MPQTTVVTLTATVPDALSAASVQAAAAAFVQTFAESVEDAAVVDCTVDGTTVLPSAADEYQAAKDALNSLGANPKPADVKAALARLDVAGARWEASLSTATPAPLPAGAVADPSAPVVAVNPHAAAAEAATVTALPDEPPATSPADGTSPYVAPPVPAAATVTAP